MGYKQNMDSLELPARLSSWFNWKSLKVKVPLGFKNLISLAVLVLLAVLLMMLMCNSNTNNVETSSFKFLDVAKVGTVADTINVIPAP